MICFWCAWEKWQVELGYHSCFNLCMRWTYKCCATFRDVLHTVISWCTSGTSLVWPGWFQNRLGCCSIHTRSSHLLPGSGSRQERLCIAAIAQTKSSRLWQLCLLQVILSTSWAGNFVQAVAVNMPGAPKLGSCQGACCCSSNERVQQRACQVHHLLPMLGSGQGCLGSCCRGSDRLWCMYPWSQVRHTETSKALPSRRMWLVFCREPVFSASLLSFSWSQEQHAETTSNKNTWVLSVGVGHS